MKKQSSTIKNNHPIVGITTTIPIEIPLAAGWKVIDLNNVFITHPGRMNFAIEAEKMGLPRTICGWNKGVLTAALISKLDRVIEVVQGDCTASEQSAEILKERGIEVLPFSYPYNPSDILLLEQMEELAKKFGTTLKEAEMVWKQLRPVRNILLEIDTLTWREGLVSGFENHLFLVSGSDLNGDPTKFKDTLGKFIEKARKRNPFKEETRVGYIGVPPMIDDLYEQVSNFGGRVVFNETQRQFSMCLPAPSLLDQYRQYTYPYSVYRRVEDIKNEVELRNIDCLIHYVQSFCFHQLEDAIFKKELSVPVLTIEGDIPRKMSQRDIIRLENFLQKVTKDKKTFYVVPSNHICRLGIDLGSRWVKIIFMKGREIVTKTRFDTMSFYREYASRSEKGFKIDIDRLLIHIENLIGERIDKSALQTGTTGYGRYLVKCVLSHTVPELQAHVKGAIYQLDIKDFTLLDIGGQDTKVVRVKGGKITDFSMNDRCAAGGGRYLENMARLMGISLSDIGNYFMYPTPLNATCATFGESEIIGKIVEGIPEEQICAGINYTVFQRVAPDLAKLYSPLLVLTGGVAHNRAIIHFIETKTNVEKVLVPPEPQFNGALGAIVD